MSSERVLEDLYAAHSAALMSFCRHLLGSREEAEDVLQQTFVRALGALRDGIEPEHPRAWLFTIARNRALSVLSARREVASDAMETVLDTRGLAEAVEHRSELRAMLADIASLPEPQRAALLLAQIEDFPQRRIAEVLGTSESRVKTLVFRARQALMADRAARAVPCGDIRAELSIAHGPDLRRAALRRHLRQCPGCRAFQRGVAFQRDALAVLLPVGAPSGLLAKVLAARWRDAAWRAGARREAAWWPGVAARGVVRRRPVAAPRPSGRRGGGRRGGREWGGGAVAAWRPGVGRRGGAGRRPVAVRRPVAAPRPGAVRLARLRAVPPRLAAPVSPVRSEPCSSRSRWRSSSVGPRWAGRPPAASRRRPTRGFRRRWGRRRRRSCRPGPCRPSSHRLRRPPARRRRRRASRSLRRARPRAGRCAGSVSCARRSAVRWPRSSRPPSGGPGAGRVPGSRRRTARPRPTPGAASRPARERKAAIKAGSNLTPAQRKAVIDAGRGLTPAQRKAAIKAGSTLTPAQREAVIDAGRELTPAQRRAAVDSGRRAHPGPAGSRPRRRERPRRRSSARRRWRSSRTGRPSSDARRSSRRASGSRPCRRRRRPRNRSR